jgi:hypothetical protein
MLNQYLHRLILRGENCFMPTPCKKIPFLGVDVDFGPESGEES